jgi:RNase adapter protein RapZ
VTDQPHVVIVTGMSGAGRSQTAKVLEDLGFFVVDNLPPSLIPNVVERAGVTESPRSRIAVVVDTRGGLTFEDLDEALRWLAGHGIRTTVLFLDAEDDVLIRRFQETRRRHPVAAPSLSDSIARERQAFESIRGEADIIVDTTGTNVHELRDRIRDAFSGAHTTPRMRVDVTSFGFKRGAPRGIDLMLDVRFLPNPHWVPELRPHTGLDADVQQYVLSQPDAGEFLDKVQDLLDFLLPRYEAEGKSYLTIGVGCTGGQHRSVVIAEEIGRHLADLGVEVGVRHKELGE